MNEDVSPTKDGDFPASHVSFRGVLVFESEELRAGIFWGSTFPLLVGIKELMKLNNGSMKTSWFLFRGFVFGDELSYPVTVYGNYGLCHKS